MRSQIGNNLCARKTLNAHITSKDEYYNVTFRFLTSTSQM